MTISYVQPDFTVQDAATYKANIDQATAALAQLAINFLAHEQAVPVMTIRVEAGRIQGATFIVQAAQSTGTITAPSVNPRIDRISINTATGAVVVTAGAENASPVAPDYPAAHYPVAQVLLATSTTSIVNAMMTDERPLIQAAGGGSPVLTSSAATGATVTFGSLPAGISAFKLIFEGVSLSTTGLPRVRLGNVGGLLTTGYVGSTWQTDDGGGVTAGLAITDIDLITQGLDTGLTIPGGNVTQGIIDFQLVNETSHIWIGQCQMSTQAATSEYFLANTTITLTTVLTQVAIVASAGTFDLGTFHLKY